MRVPRMLAILAAPDDKLHFPPLPRQGDSDASAIHPSIQLDATLASSTSDDAVTGMLDPVRLSPCSINHNHNGTYIGNTEYRYWNLNGVDQHAPFQGWANYYFD